MAIEDNDAQRLELYAVAIEEIEWCLNPDFDLEDVHLTWSRDSLGRQTASVLSATTVVGTKEDTINRLVEELKSHELYLIQTYGTLNEPSCLAAHLRNEWINFMVNAWDRKTDDEGGWSTSCHFAVTAEHGLMVSSASDLMKSYHPSVHLRSTQTNSHLLINIRLWTANGEVSQTQSTRLFSSLEEVRDAVHAVLTELMA